MPKKKGKSLAAKRKAEIRIRVRITGPSLTQLAVGMRPEAEPYAVRVLFMDRIEIVAHTFEKRGAVLILPPRDIEPQIILQ